MIQFPKSPPLVHIPGPTSEGTLCGLTSKGGWVATDDEEITCFACRAVHVGLVDVDDPATTEVADEPS